MWGGMEPLPETSKAFRNLLMAKQIPWQFCTMGHADEKTVSGDSEVHHPLRTRYAINVGVGILSAHRAIEVGSVPDMFYLSKLANAFWSMRRHDDYFPEPADYTTPVTRGKFLKRKFLNDRKRAK